MNLAAPAPRVEPAIALKADRVEAATASMAQQGEAMKVEAAAKVEPATVYEKAMDHAPPSVLHADKNTKIHHLSVKTLRGGSGADFCSYAAVLRGAPSKNFLQKCLPCIYDERDFVAYSEVKKYILVKGMSCFVYASETDPSPLYAIPLEEVYAILEERDRLDPTSVTISPVPGTSQSRPEFVTVLFKYHKDNAQAYQFTFDASNDASLVTKFMDAIDGNKKKQGQTVTASVVMADRVAEKAKQNQPLI